MAVHRLSSLLLIKYPNHHTRPGGMRGAFKYFQALCWGMHFTWMCLTCIYFEDASKTAAINIEIIILLIFTSISIFAVLSQRPKYKSQIPPKTLTNSWIQKDSRSDRKCQLLGCPFCIAEHLFYVLCCYEEGRLPKILNVCICLLFFGFLLLEIG